MTFINIEYQYFDKIKENHNMLNIKGFLWFRDFIHHHQNLRRKSSSIFFRC